MDIKTLYAKIGGNYEDVKGRLLTDERISKFVKRFPADGSFTLLKTSLAEKNVEEAFRAAHTLKGLAQNLGFTQLYLKAAPLTEILRSGCLEVGSFPCEIEELYNLTINAITQLD